MIHYDAWGSRRLVDETAPATKRQDVLRFGDHVRLSFPSLVAHDANIEIVPGPSDGAPLAPGERLRAAAPMTSVSGREILKDFRAALAASTQPTTRP